MTKVKSENYFITGKEGTDKTYYLILSSIN